MVFESEAGIAIAAAAYAADRAIRWYIYHRQRWQEATRDLYLNSRHPTTTTAVNYAVHW